MEYAMFLVIANMFIVGSFLTDKTFDKFSMLGLALMWVVLSWLA